MNFPKHSIMNTRPYFLILLLVTSGILIQLFSGCQRKPKEIPGADPVFIPHIAAFTSGIISSGSAIKVRLTEPSPAFAGENQPAP